MCASLSMCVLMPASLINFPLTQRKVRIAIFTFKQQIQKKANNLNSTQILHAGKTQWKFHENTHIEYTHTHTHILPIISSFSWCEIESAFVCALCAVKLFRLVGRIVSICNWKLLGKYAAGKAGKPMKYECGNCAAKADRALYGIKLLKFSLTAFEIEIK